MNATQRARQLLLEYFAAVGAAPRHLFSVRDFNTHVMMNAYDPEDRAGLKFALAELVAEHILQQLSGTEYLLTPEGLSVVEALKHASPQPR